MRIQNLRRVVKRLFTSKIDGGELGGEQTDMWHHPQPTSNCCRWQPPYICSHDSPRKWNQSKWLN